MYVIQGQPNLDLISWISEQDVFLCQFLISDIISNRSNIDGVYIEECLQGVYVLLAGFI